MGSADWEIPNLNANQGPKMLYTLWILIGVSTVVVAARLWTKARITHRLYYDDMLMLLALAFGVGQAITTTISIHHGLGQHMEALTPHEKNESIRTGIPSLAWGIASCMTGRIAFCVTMLFLTGTDPHVRKWPVWMFIALQFAVNMMQILAFYFQCGTHLDYYWTPSKQYLVPTTCRPDLQTKLGYVAGASNCLTDAFLSLLPALLIQHTRLSTKKKLGLVFLLCLSIVALAAAVMKTYEAKDLSAIADITWGFCSFVIWLSIELNVVIIVASIPLLRPLFRRRTKQYTPELQSQSDSMNLKSMFSMNSKSGVRPSGAHRSLSSQENIVSHQDQWYHDPGPVIHVTREVSVTYQPSDAPFVHAALVGLVQGEIANPWLTRR